METVADQIAAALRDDDGNAAQARIEARQRLENRRRKVLAKLDRGYEDLIEGRITEDFWNRKSGDWEDERCTIETELARLAQTNGQVAVTAEKVLELAKKAEFLYKTQDPAEERRLLETVLSNCIFDRGSLCPTYSKPFDLFAQGNETGNWRRGWDSELHGVSDPE
jgi:site-specific DNA recombinase